MAKVRKLPLHEPAIAAAPRADPAVRPLLAGRPRQRVVCVLSVVLPRGEVAVRLVAPTDVDDDGGVALTREVDAPGDEALARGLIRRPLDDRRQTAAA